MVTKELLSGEGDNLEKRTFDELLELFFNETITYRNSLLKGDNGSPYHSAAQINENIREEYMKRTKPLRDELKRRENLYLDY